MTGSTLGKEKKKGFRVISRSDSSNANSQAYIVVVLTNAHQYAFLYETYHATHRRILGLEIDDAGVHFEDNALALVSQWKSC